MIRRPLVAAVFVASFIPSIAFAQANRDAIAKQLEASERAIYVAIQMGDLAAFRAIVVDDGFLKSSPKDRWQDSRSREPRSRRRPT
ncbi:MAG: hypothetical protein K2Y23_13120 [Cyanobacteria bacterium]|nr:hypothetical protein [Cyanobacteriota bacterium]